MSETYTVGLVGAGTRGLSHLEHIYEVTACQYVGNWNESGPKNAEGFPFGIYHDYASEIPQWAEDISHLKAEVTAVCDPSSEAQQRASRTCRNHGDDPELFESFDDFRSADEYDAVIVASPNQTHTQVVVPLLNDGINTFCEKPLATTLPDHDRIIEAAESSDGVLYVGFNMRHAPKYARLAELVTGGRIGRLGMLSAHEVRVPFPRGHYYTQKESGGTLLEKDCHDFDIFNWIVEGEPTRVAAFGGQQVFDSSTDVIDHATVIVEYTNGVKAALELCLYAPFSHPGDRSYVARGTEGIIRSGTEPGTLDVFGRDTRDKLSVMEGDAEHGGADFRMWVDVMRVLEGESRPPAKAIDAKKAAAIAIGAERAIEEDRMFAIDEQYDLH